MRFEVIRARGTAPTYNTCPYGAVDCDKCTMHYDEIGRKQVDDIFGLAIDVALGIVSHADDRNANNLPNHKGYRREATDQKGHRSSLNTMNTWRLW
jgi:hypothetical protein